MLGIPLGLLAANATEWIVHKFLLHGQGKRRDSVWSFHWHEHHAACRRDAHIDRAYARSAFAWNSQGKELAGLVGLSALVVPWFPVAPFFVTTVLYSGYNYFRVHKRAHLQPEWAREQLPWHYDHHMGPRQDANWCVTRPWFDHIMGTREHYVGTERERRDRQRAQRRLRVRSVRARAA